LRLGGGGVCGGKMIDQGRGKGKKIGDKRRGEEQSRGGPAKTDPKRKEKEDPFSVGELNWGARGK